MSILIVDDELQSLTVLTETLSSEGFSVRPVDGGKLALASAEVELPELILLDIRMPRINGFEVCSRLKQNPRTRDIPLIFLSASGELSDRLEAFRLGAVDYISKPFQRDELLARVRQHMKVRTLRLQLEQRVAERTGELHESEERFQNMADSAPVMIWASGTDKLCTYFSRRWLEFTGRTLNDELGNGWTEGIHPEDHEGCMRTYCSRFDRRESLEVEYRLRRADGEYRWILDQGVPRFAPDGAFLGYIGSCIDITDMKHSQERMLAAQKLESLGVMAAGVAHDFGNLLGTILAEIDLALMDMTEGAPGRENLKKIEAVATHTAELVKMLMASAGARADTATFGPVDLSLEVDQMLRMLKVSISKKAEVLSNLPKDLPSIFGNVAQIRQIVINLVTNASEALGNKPGLINVTTAKIHRDSDSGMYWSHLPEGDYIQLIVSDNGCGISKDNRMKIFDQFFTTKSQGRGLGLAAVHGIVRSHRGAINVESELGAGAKFEVLLPCTSAAE